MKQFAVAYMNFFSSSLSITFQQGETWKDALSAVISFDANDLSDDIEIAKEDAFNQDWLFDVKELPTTTKETTKNA